jgi:hypothetical protein
MITPKILYLKTNLLRGSRDLVFTADHLVCGGWVGRDQAGLRAHIEELGLLGVPAPRRIPIYMIFSPYLLTTDDEISVIGERTSAEVEYVLLCSGNEAWVTVGSDHTDRDVETKSIPASKQMYAKCLPPECWPYPEVQDHWDRLILRSWVTRGQERSLYQEAPLSEILGPEEMLAKMPRDGIDKKEGLILFSGTIPTRGGVVFGDSYELELEDPVLKRIIKHHYGVRILPQYI